MVIQENHRTYGDYTFDLEFDKGDPEFPIIIYVKESKKPNKVIGQRCFKNGTDEQHLHNFMKKIARSEDYRQKWNVDISEEQKLRHKLDEQMKELVNLRIATDIYLTTLMRNAELKELFLEEIRKDNYMVAPLQIKIKERIKNILMNDE